MVSPKPQIITLASFDYTDGFVPYSALIADAQGNLYGTARAGGVGTVFNGDGTVFEVINGTGVVTTLAEFNGPNGASPYGGLIADAQGNLYGTTATGGANDLGTVFEFVKATGTLKTLASFNGANGSIPSSDLIADASGNLYGTAGQGGDHGLGTVFELASGTGVITALVSFDGTHGTDPGSGRLYADTQGNLYGTTGRGGSNDLGTVFEIANGTGVITTLATFAGTDGADPLSGVIADAQGNLYGATYVGGAGYGTIFEVAKGTNTVTTLASFNEANGAYTFGSLIIDAQGNLFGLSQIGDAYDLGGVFEVVKGSNTITVLASFTGANGARPLDRLLADAQGNLYGTTAYGGANNDGSVFELTGSGFVVPAPPTVTLTSAAAASRFAAQTIAGKVVTGSGAAVAGQIVTLKDNGAILGTATVQADGTFSAGMTLPNQGANSIVATVSDSYGNIGTSAGVVDTLDSVAPMVTLTSAAEASRFAAQTITGKVVTGGAAAVVGQIVTLKDNGGTLGTATVLADGTFSAGVTLPNQGANSIVATVSDSYGNVGTSAAVVDTLYAPPTIAITSASEAGPFASQTITGIVKGGAGGGSVVITGNGRAIGTANVAADGTFTANVVLASEGGNAVVATLTDGQNNTAISAAVTDTLTTRITTLASFDYTNGFVPYAGLIADAQGNLYGTARAGGVGSVFQGDGTVFEVVKGSGAVTTVAEFNGPNGASPYGDGLIADAQGNLYGTTAAGGASDQGTVFEFVKATGTLITLASFNGANGSGPSSDLTADAAGNLYGTAAFGGDNGLGIVFKLAHGTGVITALASFDGSTGSRPWAGLLADSQGNLYGTARFGGAHNDGTVFEVAKGTSAITTLVSFDGTAGSQPIAGLVADAQGNLYGATYVDGTGYGTIFEVAKGTNTVTTLASFNEANGAYTAGSLIIDAQGNLFGLSQIGDAYDLGGVFEVVKGSNTITVLASFTGANGARPLDRLLADAQGNLYGTTAYGGANNDGSVFELTGSGFVVPAPPMVTLTSVAEASNRAAQTITGMVASGGGVVVGQTVTLKDNGTTIGTTTVRADGTFSAGVTLPNQGANSIVASVSDRNGKAGVSAAVIDTLDSVAPTVKIANPSITTNAPGQSIAGTVVSGGTAAVVGQQVTLTDNGAFLAKAAVGANGTFSVKVTLPNGGGNSIVASVSDSYGNVGSSNAVIYTLRASTTVIHLAGSNNVVAGPTTQGAATGLAGPSILGKAAGYDTISGTGANQSLTVFASGNTIVAGGGDVTITAGLGFAHVITSAIDGDTTIDGASVGNTKVTLGKGRETISLGGLNNVVSLGAGVGSVISLGAGYETFSAAGGSAALSAGGYNDSFTLGAGQFSIGGMAGNATVALGSGFAAGGSLDLTGTAKDSFSVAGGVLTVGNPDGSTYAAIDARAAGGGFSFAADGHGGVTLSVLAGSGLTGQLGVGAGTTGGIVEPQGYATLGLGAAAATVGSVHLAGYGNSLTGGAGDVSVDGALGYTSVALGTGYQNVVLTGYGNNVTLGGNAGAAGRSAFVNAGAGNATVRVGDGSNVILAGGYNNTVNVGNGLNVIFDASIAAAKLLLPANHGLLAAELGVANVTLGTGTNYVTLGGTNNTVHSNGGTDILVSGTGVDTFKVDAGGGHISIKSFGLTNNDLLDLTSLHASSVKLTASGSDTLITAAGGGGTTLITLVGETGFSLAGLQSHNSLRY